jgi:hypothetical protein
LDFVGPLSLTPRHNQYVLVIIEHFSKLLELVALLDYKSEGVTNAFLDKVFNRFGALAEVFTNQCIEFRGEFQKLCERALIDHCTTSQNHPEAD